MQKIILTFLISFNILSAQTLNDLYFGSDTTFDVISWNIEWFPNNSNTPEYVEEILTNLQADVYALQEIQDTTLLKQVVSNISGYECYFNNNYNGGLAYVFNTNTININAKYEIYTSQSFWNPFPRSPQVLDIDYMGQNYIIINNHLKCCGDGILDVNNNSDEENRRYQAMTYLKQFIDNNLSNKKVIVLGDLNDDLNDNQADNIFNDIILDNTNYSFVDMPIAQGNSNNWSYPTWPSHLDHILITNEIFSDFQNSQSSISVIRVDDYMGSWSNYENNVSDHRPIGLKLSFNILSNTSNVLNDEKKLLKVNDFFGRNISEKSNFPILYIYDDGTVDKKIVID